MDGRWKRLMYDVPAVLGMVFCLFYFRRKTYNPLIL